MTALADHWKSWLALGVNKTTSGCGGPKRDERRGHNMMRDLLILLKASIKVIIMVAIVTALIAFFLPPIVHLGSSVYSFSEDLWTAALAKIH